MTAVHDEERLPPYRLRLSSRAKYVRLRILPGGELELVLPRHVDLAEGEAFLRSRVDWVERTRQRMGGPDGDRRLACREAPRRLCLAATAETWRVRYVRCAGSRARLEEMGTGQLQIAGGEDDLAATRGLLREWLKRHARRVLPEWLEAVSRRTGLGYQRVTVRLQKTRWGSCSSRRNINLNAKLLFLPREQVEYVLLHELCHTRELNHSPAFWSLVQGHMPRARELDRKLRHAGRHVPPWIHCD